MCAVKIDNKFMQKFMSIFLDRAEKLFEEGLSKEEVLKNLGKHDFTHEIDIKIKEVAIKTIENLDKNMSDILEKQKIDDDEFMNNQQHKWGDCFELYETMYIFALKAAGKYCTYVCEKELEEKKYVPWSFITLRELHGRGCQIFAEILCLIKNGFADGAYARWRSLFEISVIMDFIKRNGEEVAKSFYEASESEMGYQDWAKVLPEFKEMKHVKFSDIRKTCDFTKGWLKEYKNSSWVVHASPQGTFGRISVTLPRDVIPVGKSDYGIDLAAFNACISFNIICIEFFTLFSTYETIIDSKVILTLSEIVRDSFIERAKEVFKKPENNSIKTVYNY